MSTILDKILHEKKKEVVYLKNSSFFDNQTRKTKRSFIQKLEQAEEISIISEFKRSSPSKGVINHDVEPAVQAALYEKNGASAISVLTDGPFFKGSYADLLAVRDAVDLPILCKDFIIDSIQIDNAFNYGADIILLIVAALEDTQLTELFQFAKDKDLEVLIEVHNQEELEKALKTGAKLIGVNNRNLKTFEVSLNITEALAAMVKNSGAYLISESGIHTQEDVARVVRAGANGILVGEALMRSTSLNQTFRDFSLPLIKENV
jgi:indole-3-glycerol phosphate synthase